MESNASGRLAGKTAVVIGAGQTPGATTGNGRATAVLFAREGARVFLVDRDEASVRETAAMINGELPGRASAMVADITDENACQELARRALADLGRIDVLHNNVGIGDIEDGDPVDVPTAVWDRILSVNLRGMWLTCKHVVPLMREQRSGSVVNISSLAAIAATSTLTAYKISKAGVNALTHNLAVSNARFGVRVNAIMPGLIDTPMAVDAPAAALGMSREDLAGARASLVPLGRQGTADDVARAALFLASDEAAFITGVVLPVDGGQAARIGG